MKINFFNKAIKHKKNRVGIDIGSHSVKSAELSQGEKNTLKIQSIGYAKIEDPASKESITRAIRESAGKAGALGKDVAIAVSGPSVIVRFIELPHMSESELRNAIPFEAEKYIPFNINEVTVDHQLLIPHLGSGQMLVLLVAVKKDFINERLSLVSGAGLSADILDIASFANVNAFLACATRKKDEVTALIDMGSKAMDISIIDGDVLYFTRSIQIGGDDITKILSESMSIDKKSAEDLKINPADRVTTVREKTDPILRNMTDETRLSFSYYENQSGKAIEKVYLTGGGSRIVGLHDVFKGTLGLDVLSWDPTESIEKDALADAQLITSIKDQLGVAIGLALR